MECPVCDYPLAEKETVVFGLLYKCRNQACPSKRFGHTARTLTELWEIKELLENQSR
jgi:hypothetical protein